MTILKQDFQFLYFEFGGRISRSQYWIGSIVLILVYAAIKYLSGLIFPAMINAVLVIPMICFAITVPVALTVKRLHDRGRSGWWYLGFCIMQGLLTSALLILPKGTILLYCIVMLQTILTIILIIEVGILKGSTGENRYGADPIHG